MNLERYIRDVPDFPKKDIIFKDIMPLLSDIAALREAARQLAGPYESSGVEVVTGVESRGFIFGAMVAGDPPGSGDRPPGRTGRPERDHGGRTAILVCDVLLPVAVHFL